MAVLGVISMRTGGNENSPRWENKKQENDRAVGVWTAPLRGKRQMGESLAIVSGKGGVGKTAVAAGVASCLAALGKKTICVDADFGLRNLDIAMGLSESALFDLGDVLAGRATLEKAIIRHPEVQNLYLLAAPLDMTASDVDSEAFGQIIRELSGQYDFCVIDCAAGIGRGFRTVCSAAGKAVVVATTDIASLRDSQRVGFELEDMGVSEVRLVINRIRPRLIRKRDMLNVDDAMDMTGLRLLGVIPEDDNVIACTNHGVLIILQADTGAALAYFNIAQRLCGEQVPISFVK